MQRKPGAADSTAIKSRKQQQGRKRLHSSEPESEHQQVSHHSPSPVTSPGPGQQSAAQSQLRVPRSPRTPGTNPGQHHILSLNRPMTHMIAHRFTKTFKPARCDLCQEYFFQGLKCKECKFRCHAACEQSVPPSCGLPDQLLDP